MTHYDAAWLSFASPGTAKIPRLDYDAGCGSYAQFYKVFSSAVVTGHFHIDGQMALSE
jgi:hypothetical protein